MTGYTFDARFDRYKATRIYKVLKAGAIAKKSGTSMIATLKTRGISYRLEQMQHDIRRARAVEFAKTSDAKLSSGRFFDYVYEPFRDKYDLKSTDVNKILRDKDRDFWEDEEELEQIMEIEDRYVKLQELL